ncbi:MAG: translation initiation factor IF-2 [Pseudomonadota bacterium]
MAKVRVYELAKDLNMTNRALLNKMKELKIEVKSHMSSLEDSDVRAIRQSFLGKNKQKTDVKVRPSVIRRRRLDVTDDAEESDAQAGDDETIESEVIVEDQHLKDATVTIEETRTPMETPDEKTAPASESVADGKIRPEPEKETLKSKQKKKSPAARVIKPVIIPAPEGVKVEEEKSEKEQSYPMVEEDKASEGEKEIIAAQELVVEKEMDVKDDGISIEESSEMSQEDADSKSKKKKKKKKSTPAKIVKIADPAVLENLKKLVPGDDKKWAGPGNDVPKEGTNKKQRVIPDVYTDPLSSIVPAKVSVSKVEPVADLSLPIDQDELRRKKGKHKQRKQKSVIESDEIYSSPRGTRKKRGKKEAKGKKSNFQKTQITTPKAIKRRIKIDEAIELAELAKRMGIKANEMIAKLMTLGVMATVNQTIDFDTAVLVANEFEFEVERASFEEETLLTPEEGDDDDSNKIGRAPVVTIMGHVDHGKTSLLDVIRKSKITSGEAGGITQHIGAYNVPTPNGGKVTFLDTPGHAAFTAMRARGAQVTDIVILVVAADDGVMPQTIEAINHSKAAGVPVVVAVNKMDKPGADPDRVMRELSELGLLAEDWGGDVIFVKVSAKTGEGIDELLEMILLQSEVLELKANPDRKASGYVVESRLDIGRGAVATVLVKQGTLRDGDPVVCGLYSGRIRAMTNDSGDRIAQAGPSTPAEIVGLNGVPDAGDEFIAVATDKDAKQIAGHRMQKQRAKELAKRSRANLEKMFENLGTAEVKELRLIVKADVHGSIEALNDSLKDLAKEEVEIKIVHSGAGTINESDVSLAAVSDAIIIGFNVRPSPQIRKIAKDENVDMRFYDIIYDVINDIKAALDGMMPSTFHEIIIGRAEVTETFIVPKMGTIAGCRIVEGKMVRGKKVRLLRDGVIKCHTQLSSLRRFKDDVKSVDQGYECGIGLEKFNDIEIDDAIECYEVEERKYKAE